MDGKKQVKNIGVRIQTEEKEDRIWHLTIKKNTKNFI